jgi:hypothetical protein
LSSVRAHALRHDKFSTAAAARGVLPLTQTHHTLQMLGNSVLAAADAVSAASVPAVPVRCHGTGHLWFELALACSGAL